MKCPTCPEVALVMSERQGVEIDYCPECRGVWLDRGELDKIIERSNTQPSEHLYRNKERHYDHGNRHPYKQTKYKKHKSFWSELFD